MNQRIQKTIDEIERTKTKIAELQVLLPELERKKTDLENTEIVRLVRSANVAPGDISAFIASIKQCRQDSRTQSGRQHGIGNTDTPIPPEIKKEEATESGED